MRHFPGGAQVFIFRQIRHFPARLVSIFREIRHFPGAPKCLLVEKSNNWETSKINLVTSGVVLIASGSGNGFQKIVCARAQFLRQFPDPDAIKTTPDVTNFSVFLDINAWEPPRIRFFGNFSRQCGYSEAPPHISASQPALTKYLFLWAQRDQLRFPAKWSPE